jgi:hypothetical protein
MFPSDKELKILGLLFADNLEVASFTSYGLQKKSEPVDQYCKNCNLSVSLINLILVFKKRGKLKATERRGVNEQNIEVRDKFNYLGVTPNIKVQMLENIYEMVCESNIMYGIEVWGLNEARK